MFFRGGNLIGLVKRLRQPRRSQRVLKRQQNITTKVKDRLDKISRGVRCATRPTRLFFSRHNPRLAPLHAMSREIHDPAEILPSFGRRVACSVSRRAHIQWRVVQRVFFCLACLPFFVLFVFKEGGRETANGRSRGATASSKWLRGACVWQRLNSDVTSGDM